MTANHSTQNSISSRPKKSLALRTGGVIGAVAIAGLLLTAFGSSMTGVGTAMASVYAKNLPNVPAVSPAPRLALKSAEPMNAVDLDVSAEAPMPVDLYRFALNAFLVPLIDDSEPLRWTAVAIDHFCDPGTIVLINGEPLAAGTLVPEKPFSVRWNMNRCVPLGRESVELWGNVEVLVIRQGDSITVIVIPDGLQVDSHLGQASLHGPFAAETSLGKSITRP